MAIRSDKAMGPLDINTLLDLLNASEASSDSEPVGEADPAVSDARPVVTRESWVAELESRYFPGLRPAPGGHDGSQVIPEARREAATSERPAQDPRAAPDEVENGFAAHVVRGMAKIKRQ